MHIDGAQELLGAVPAALTQTMWEDEQGSLREAESAC